MDETQAFPSIDVIDSESSLVNTDSNIGPMESKQAVNPNDYTAQDEAFYAAGSYSANPLEDYFKIIDELETKGNSILIQGAKDAFATEQDEQLKAILSDYIAQPDIPHEKKIEALNNYRLGNFISQDIKDAYALKMSNAIMGVTEQDELVAEAANKNVLLKLQDDKADAYNQKILNESTNMLAILNNDSEATTVDSDNIASSYNEFKDSLNFVSKLVLDAGQGYSKSLPLTGRELLTISTMITSAPHYLIELAKTIKAGNFDGLENFTAAREQVMKQMEEDPSWFDIIAGNIFLKDPHNWLAKNLFGINQEEVSKSFISKGMGWLMDKMYEASEEQARFNAEMGIGTTDPMQIQVGKEIALFFVPYISNKARQKMTGMKQDAPYWDTTKLEMTDAKNTLVIESNKVVQGEATKPIKVSPENMEFDPTIVTSMGGFTPKTKGVQRKAINVEYNEKSLNYQMEKGLRYENDTPFNTSRVANTKVTQKLGEALILDDTGQVSKALRMNVQQLIENTYLPDFLGTRHFVDHPEMLPVIENLRNVQSKILTNIFTDVNLQDGVGRYEYLHKTGVMLERFDDIVPSLSLTHLKNGVNEVGMKVVYRRDNSTDFHSRRHVTEVYNTIKEKIDSLDLSKEEKGSLVIEDVKNPNAKPFTSPEALYKDAKYSRNDLGAADKHFRIAWYTKSKFDGAQYIFEGLDAYKYSTKLGKGIDTLSTNLWNWYSYTGPFTGVFKQAIDMTSMKADYAGKRQLEFLGREISNIKINMKPFEFNEKLGNLLKEQQEKGIDLFSVKEIAERYPTKGEAFHKKMHQTLAIIRQIDKFNWQLMNIFEKTRLSNKGYNRSIYMNDKYHAVKEQFQYNVKTNPLVWDVELGRSVPFESPNKFQVNHEPTRGKGGARDIIQDRNGRQLVLLETPITTEHGIVHRHALLGSKMIAKELPKHIIPYTKGHMPRQLKTNFLIRRYFKDVTVDGIKYTAKDLNDAKIKFGDEGQVGNFSEVVGVSDSMTQGKKLMRDYKWENDPNYYYELVEDKTASFSRHVEIEKVKSNIINNARQRSRNEIVGAQFEDMMTSFLRSTQYINDMAVKQSIFDQQKTNFYDTFKGKIMDSSWEKVDNKYKTPLEQYPTTKEQIKPLSTSLQDRWMAKQAQRVWDQINLKEIGQIDNAAAKVLAGIFDTAGFLLDNKLTAPLVKYAKKVSNNAEFIEGYPTRVISTTLIGLNFPFKHITLQPAAVLDTMFLPGPQVVIPNLTNMGGIITHMMKDSIYFRKHKEGLDFYMREMFDKGKLKGAMEAESRSYLMSNNDLRIAYEAMKSSGFTSINQHVMAQGMFSSNPITLHKSLMGKAGSILAYPFEKGIRAITKAGFESGEHLNRIGMWLTAKSIWENRNPKKNWRTAEALEQINYDAWKLSGAMTKEGTYAFQRASVLKWITQFTSYPMKASEIMISGSASPLSPAQRLTLAGWRLYFYGLRGGGVYGLGNLIYNLYANGDKDDQKVAEFFDRPAGINQLLNQYLGDVDPNTGEERKSDLRFEFTYSPTGTEPFAAYSPIWKVIARAAGLSNDKRYAPAPIIQKYDDLNSFINFVNTMYEYNGGFNKPEDYKALFERVAKGTTGSNAILKALIRNGARDKLNSNGQEMGMTTTEGEVWISSLLGVQEDQEMKAYEYITGVVKRTEVKKELATTLYRMYVETNPRESLNIQKLTQQMGDWKDILYSNGFNEVEINQIYNMIEELDKLRHETFMDGLINSAYEKIPTFGPNGDQSTKDKRILDKIIDDPKIKKEFERKYKTTKELKD